MKNTFRNYMFTLVVVPFAFYTTHASAAVSQEAALLMGASLSQVTGEIFFANSANDSANSTDPLICARLGGILTAANLVSTHSFFLQLKSQTQASSFETEVQKLLLENCSLTVGTTAKAIDRTELRKQLKSLETSYQSVRSALEQEL